MEIDFNKIFGIDLKKRTRKREYAMARQAAYLYLHQKGHGLTKIGKMFGYDHSTVYCSIKQMKDKLSINDPIAVSYWEKLKNT